MSRVSGKVTAATLDSDENVAGRFQLKTAVGADGVPLSPDSLVLPKEASSLPKSLRDAALGLLGKAWAVATAPAGALPKDAQAVLEADRASTGRSRWPRRASASRCTSRWPTARRSC